MCGGWEDYCLNPGSHRHVPQETGAVGKRAGVPRINSRAPRPRTSWGRPVRRWLAVAATMTLNYSMYRLLRSFGPTCYGM
jgi:hypothetical protein